MSNPHRSSENQENPPFNPETGEQTAPVQSPAGEEGQVISINGAVGNDAGGDAAGNRDGTAAMDLDDETHPNDGIDNTPSCGDQVSATPAGTSQIDSTINVLQPHIDREFAKIDVGTATPTPQTLDLIEKLASLSSANNAVCPPASASQSVAAGSSLVQTFAEALSSRPKRVVITS